MTKDEILTAFAKWGSGVGCLNGQYSISTTQGRELRDLVQCAMASVNAWTETRTESDLRIQLATLRTETRAAIQQAQTEARVWREKAYELDRYCRLKLPHLVTSPTNVRVSSVGTVGTSRTTVDEYTVGPILLTTL